VGGRPRELIAHEGAAGPELREGPPVGIPLQDLEEPGFGLVVVVAGTQIPGFAASSIRCFSISA